MREAAVGASTGLGNGEDHEDNECENKPVGGARQGHLHSCVTCGVPWGSAFRRALCWFNAALKIFF